MTKTLKHGRLTALLGGALIAISTISGAQAAEWRGWNIHVDGYPNTVAMDKFAELLSEKSGGKLTLKMFHSGVLGNQPDAIEQVRLGALDAMALTHTCYNGRRPPCGECQACRLRATGFAEAGLSDPLLDIQ